MTLYYAIKHGNIELYCHVIQDVCIILPAQSISKSKYAQTLLRQIHIIDANVADFLLQKAYFANALVNPCELPHTFL